MESLHDFNRYSTEELEQWLEHRLLDQYADDPHIRYRALDLRHIGINFGESHIDVLHELFRALSPQAQDRFRSALELLMRHPQPEAFPASGMADLILLVGLTRATKVLAAFVPILGSGPWGELNGFLVYNALGVLMTFERTQEAYDAARALASSVNFPDAYSLDAYLVMVRTRPEEWLADWGLVRKRVHRFRDTLYASSDLLQRQRLEERHQEFLSSLARSVPLSEFGRQFPRMDLRPPENRPSSDYWLLDGLLGPQGPLKLECDDDGVFTVFDRSAPERAARVSPSTGFEVVCIARKLVSDPSVEELRTLVEELEHLLATT